MVIYSKEQIRTLLQAAYEYHSVYLEILLALFAGLRKGEIAGLRYSDFDPDKQTVRIERQITKDYQIVVKNNLSYKIICYAKSSKIHVILYIVFELLFKILCIFPNYL